MQALSWSPRPEAMKHLLTEEFGSKRLTYATLDDETNVDGHDEEKKTTTSHEP